MIALNIFKKKESKKMIKLEKQESKKMIKMEKQGSKKSRIIKTIKTETETKELTTSCGSNIDIEDIKKRVYG